MLVQWRRVDGAHQRSAKLPGACRGARAMDVPPVGASHLLVLHPNSGTLLVSAGKWNINTVNSNSSNHVFVRCFKGF